MEITNFKYLGKSGKDITDYKFYATVDESNGFWIFKKVVTREVARNYLGDWFYVDTGKYCLGWSVSRLERSFCAQHKDDLQNIEP